MLRSINKLLHRKYVARHGCMGIYCSDTEVSSVLLRASGGEICVDETSSFTADGAGELLEEISRCCQKVAKSGALINIGVSSTICPYYIISLSGLPVNRKAQPSFVKWRYEKLFGRKLVGGQLLSSVATQLDGKHLVAVSEGSELIKNIVHVAEGFLHQVNAVRPLPEFFPVAIRSVPGEATESGIVLRLTTCRWMLSFIGLGKVLYHREQSWLNLRKVAYLNLAEDIKRVKNYFQPLFTENGITRICAVGCQWEFSELKLLLERDGITCRWITNAGEFISGRQSTNNETPSIDSLLIALAGADADV